MQERTSENHQDEEHLSSGPAIPPEEVEAELRRILASPTFRKAPRHSRFLSFVVRKALAGYGESLKEYLIGLEVFDREADYDPGADPVVRVEAGRLRSRLADYYKKLGKSDPVRIDLPKGTYIPLFHRNGIAPAEAALDDGTDRIAIPDAGPSTVVSNNRRLRWSWALAIVLALCVLAGYAVHRWRKSRALASALAARPLVLAEFTNTTSDSVFDGTLRQGLAAQLEQSPFLHLLPDQRIADTLTLMSQPKDTRLTHPLAREVCQRTSSAAVVKGSIALHGSQYLLGLSATSCADGERLADVEVTADRRDQVLKAMGKAATKLRAELGESLASIQKYDVPLESATTSSLEALQAYSLADRAKDVWGDFATAAPLFQRAIGLDPNFAMAYAKLGTIYDMQHLPGGDENLLKAFDLRERVSLREKFYIESHYHHLVTGDRLAAAQVYQLWAQTYPNDVGPHANLGQIYGTLGDHAKELDAFHEAVKLQPGDALMNANLVLAYIELNRLDEARAVAREARARNLDPSLTHLELYVVDFLEHDTADMETEAAGLKRKPDWEARMLDAEATTAAYSGQFVSSRDLTRRAVDLAQRAGHNEIAASYEATAAVHEAVVGNARLAIQRAQASFALSKSSDVAPVLALALAGDTARATRLAADLGKQWARSTEMQLILLPTVRAAFALASGKSAEAIETLAPVTPYELSDVMIVALYPVYIRGNAYLAEGRGPEAAVEYQKIIDHSGIVMNDPIGALAHLGLGRAYALAGDTATAKTAYQDFLALWKDADPDIPIYKQAKAEYAKLK
jgi:eukaryotic-like serine/threonine-protein kinase